MIGQMNVFDYLYPDEINPIKEVALRASPYWTTSMKRIHEAVDAKKAIKSIALVVKREYCPYGCSGFCGGSKEPNTLSGYDMRSDKIAVEWYDANRDKRERWYSWEDFAYVVRDLVYEGVL